MIDALMISIVTLVLGLISLYKWVIIISAVLSWVQPDPFNPIVQTLNRLTYPAYRFIRRLIPTNFGGVDIAPIVLIFGLVFIETFLTQLFFSTMR